MCWMQIWVPRPITITLDPIHTERERYHLKNGYWTRLLVASHEAILAASLGMNGAIEINVLLSMCCHNQQHWRQLSRSVWMGPRSTLDYKLSDSKKIRSLWQPTSLLCNAEQNATSFDHVMSQGLPSFDHVMSQGLLHYDVIMVMWSWLETVDIQGVGVLQLIV